MNGDLPAEVVHHLLNHAPIDPTGIEQAQTRLREQFSDCAIPTLNRIPVIKSAVAEPAPCLALERCGPIVDDHARAAARLTFNYAGLSYRRDDPPFVYDGDKVVEIVRNEHAEAAAVRRLQELGFGEKTGICRNNEKDCFTLSQAEDWVVFQSNCGPQLTAAGWTIRVDEEFPYQAAEKHVWFGEVRQIEDNEWFDLELGVDIEGQRVNLVDVLLHVLREFPHGIADDYPGETIVMHLQGHRYLPVPTEKMRFLLHILYELHQEGAVGDNTALTVTRSQLLRMVGLEPGGGDAMRWLGDDNIKDKLQALRRTREIPAVVTPAGLETHLRNYQQQGLNWLQFLRRHEFGGILADDMGLGKTVQTLASLLVEKQAGRLLKPCLVIAPTSLMHNWRHEAARFAPLLKTLTLHGAQRQKSYRQVKDHDLVFTSYPLVVRDRQWLLQQEFYYLILDEAHVIKNAGTQVSRTVKSLRSRHRLCLTGTPMENHLGELWSLFDFIAPGLLGDAKQFRALFRTPIEKHASASAADRLRARIRPFMLRRDKEHVEQELPGKTDIIHRVSLEGGQRQLYETVRLAMHQRVRREIQRRGLARSRLIVLDALLKLRQVCCDPRLVKMDQAKAITESAKLEWLVTLLPDLLYEGRRILLFSQFTAMLALIEKELTRLQIVYAKLTGQTRHRQEQIELFQQQKVPLFLISLKAGGVGLNLTAADTIIHYDPWWNPAAEKQATDRAHRIGQKKSVFVYKLICEGTVEQKILQMQQFKDSLARQVFAPGGMQEPEWSEQDIEQLLAPLDA